MLLCLSFYAQSPSWIWWLVRKVWNSLLLGTHLTLLSSCSLVGGVALKALFGLNASPETLELKTVGGEDDKLEFLSRFVSTLEHIPEVEGSGDSLCAAKPSPQEVMFHMFGKIKTNYWF